MYKQMQINGKVVNVVKVKAIQNVGHLLNVYVDNSDNVGIPAACHALPKQWFDGNSSQTITTGGNKYKLV